MAEHSTQIAAGQDSEPRHPYYRCRYCGGVFKRNGRRRPTYCSVPCRSYGEAVPVLTDAAKLRELYARHTAEQIGVVVGRSRKIVELWLRRHGIPQKDGGRGKSPNCRRIRKGEPNPMAGRKHTPESRRLMSEIAKAQGRRPYKLENGPPWKGKGGPGHPAWKGGVSPERLAFYETPEWKAAARAVWKRDRGCCRRCGRQWQRGEQFAFDIHHIVSFAYKPLRAELSNLALLCEPCHYWVHGKENAGRVFLKDPPSEGE